MSLLGSALTLPCGATIPNRLAKAAMTEGLADPRGRPTAELERLYRVWGAGGCGLLISGNVIIDRSHLERPGNVICESDFASDSEAMAAMRRWTAAATAHGAHFWAQISHAGRQTQAKVNPHPRAPSAVKLGLPGGQFGEPVAMDEAEIAAVIAGFARTAATCVNGGFTGVQVHAAHGYLLSQFLSPRSNLRTDRWGGTLDNRARLLLDVVAAVRAAIGPLVPLAVKLNSADFQRGGFAFEESLQVARWLEAAGVDCIEISGGTYEQPKLLGIAGMEPEEAQQVAASTLAREAYFVDFAKAMREHVSIPLMATGGFRTSAAMEQAVEAGAADLIGLARPLCVEPAGAALLLAGSEALPRAESELALLPSWLAPLRAIPMVRAVDGFAVQYWYYSQITALGQTGRTTPDRSVFAALREVEGHASRWLKAHRTLNR
jgi:2,4-dienoyl-CoA reductase-like NADH-dependent reductase (Old Yellow Enzyme family)